MGKDRGYVILLDSGDKGTFFTRKNAPSSVRNASEIKKMLGHVKSNSSQCCSLEVREYTGKGNALT